MNKIVIIIGSLLTCSIASAQTRTVQYTHDTAGNRTRQEVVTGRSANAGKTVNVQEKQKPVPRVVASTDRRQKKEKKKKTS